MVALTVSDDAFLHRNAICIIEVFTHKPGYYSMASTESGGEQLGFFALDGSWLAQRLM